MRPHIRPVDLARLAMRGLTAADPARRALRRASRAELLPGWFWKRLPVEAAFEVSYGPDVRFVYASSAYDAIGRLLYWKDEGWVEPESVGPFLQLARRAELVLDVGANTGLYSLLAAAANPESLVIAFEPVPRLRARLQANILANRWQGRILPQAEGVADAPGEARFHVPDEQLPTTGSLHPDGFRGAAGEHIDVTLTTVDAVAGASRVDLMKIDVEGFEHKVLGGMPTVLARDQPAILLECNPDGPAAELTAILKAAGYGLYHLRDVGPAEVDAIAPGGDPRWRNFLALPPSKVGWL